MSQPVLEPRAGSCVGFGESAAGGTQVTSGLAVHGVGFSVGQSNISTVTQGHHRESRIHGMLAVSLLHA